MISFYENVEDFRRKTKYAVKSGKLKKMLQITYNGLKASGAEALFAILLIQNSSAFSRSLQIK